MVLFLSLGRTLTILPMAPTGALSTQLQTLNQTYPNLLALSSHMVPQVRGSPQEVETLRELKVQSAGIIAYYFYGDILTFGS